MLELAEEGLLVGGFPELGAALAAELRSARAGFRESRESTVSFPIANFGDGLEDFGVTMVSKQKGGE